MKPFFDDGQVTLYHGRALEVARALPSSHADCIVTSPPYYNLRDYEEDGQYGLEGTPAEYVAALRELFAELYRVLADDGTLWLNLGDSYAGTGALSDPALTRIAQGRHVNPVTGMPAKRFDRPRKSLLGLPWRVAFALQDDGWLLRNAITWAKPNALPDCANDRFAARCETVFLFAKQQRYWFDLDAVREPHPTNSAAKAAVRHGATASGTAASAVDSPIDRQRVRGGNISPGARRPRNGGTGPHHKARHDKGRNPGDYWEFENGDDPGGPPGYFAWVIPTAKFPEAHFATMPPALALRCVRAGCKPGGSVLDPCSGSGTTGLAAQQSGRRFIGIDINASYLRMSLRTRLRDAPLDLDLHAEGA